MKTSRWKMRKLLQAFPLIGARVEAVRGEIAFRNKQLRQIEEVADKFPDLLEKLEEKKQRAAREISLLSLELERWEVERRKIADALKKLPPDLQAVITAVYIDGRGDFPPAADYGLSESNFRKAVARGLDEMAFVLGVL